MQKTIGILAALLVAQLLLAVGTGFTGSKLATVQPDTPLLDLGDRLVDRLTIEDSDNQQLTLARHGESWVLPETGDFPADTSKVDRLLDRLQSLKRGLAVATSESASRRFKVSGDDFERRVVIAQGDEPLTTLYFGTTPGMRRVHVRTVDEDAVYAVEFGIHDAPVKREDWEDKTVLQIPPAELDKIAVADITLARVPGNGSRAVFDNDADKQQPERANWTIEVLAEDETVNQSKVDALVKSVTGLRIAAVLGSEVKPEYGLEHPELVINLQRKDGREIEYQLGKRDKENDYVLKASSRPDYFRLPSSTGDALVAAAKREQLVSLATKVASEGDIPPRTVDPKSADSPDESVQGLANEEVAP